jgi:hypothetical protein
VELNRVGKSAGERTSGEKKEKFESEQIAGMQGERKSKREVKNKYEIEA